MGFQKFGIVLAVTAIFAFPSLLHAAGAVDVSADSFESIDAEHKTIFRGNVVAIRPTDTTKSDEMTITSGDEKQADGTTKNVTKLVECKGNVTIITKDATITGDLCRLDVPHDKLVVTGAIVTLKQGSTVLKGKQLDVDLKSNHIQMTGGRVNGNFVPN